MPDMILNGCVGSVDRAQPTSGPMWHESAVPTTMEP